MTNFAEKQRMVWLTEIQAVDPDTGETCTWSGPRVRAESIEDAQRYCDGNEMGYCRVIGEFIMDIEITEDHICLN